MFMLVGCGPKQIPRFEGKIFTLDNKEMLLRYKYDQFLMSVYHEDARGAVVFLPDDFQKFMEAMVLSCDEWAPGTKLIAPGEVSKENGLIK
jgi:hypothetical protein